MKKRRENQKEKHQLKKHSSQSNESSSMKPSSLLTVQRLNKFKHASIRKPYVYTFIAIFVGYLAVNIFLNQLYITGPESLSNPIFAIPFVSFNLIVAALVALNINLIIIKFKDLKSVHQGSTFALLGTFAGVMGGACPGCFVGV